MKEILLLLKKKKEKSLSVVSITEFPNGNISPNLYIKYNGNNISYNIMCIMERQTSLFLYN